MALQRKSEYLCGQSAEVRERYESKVKCTRLCVDPYGIEESEYGARIRNISKVGLDQSCIICLYMTSTPSLYPNEAVKVCKCVDYSTFYLNAKLSCGRHGKQCLIPMDGTMVMCDHV